MIKTILDVRIEIGIIEISNVPNFNFEANLGLTGGKYFLKIIFDIEIEIGILEILNVPDFDRFRTFLILGTCWA